MREVLDAQNSRTRHGQRQIWPSRERFEEDEAVLWSWQAMGAWQCQQFGLQKSGHGSCGEPHWGADWAEACRGDQMQPWAWADPSTAAHGQVPSSRPASSAQLPFSGASTSGVRTARPGAGFGVFRNSMCRQLKGQAEPTAPGLFSCNVGDRVAKAPARFSATAHEAPAKLGPAGGLRDAVRSQFSKVISDFGAPVELARLTKMPSSEQDGTGSGASSFLGMGEESAQEAIDGQLPSLGSEQHSKGQCWPCSMFASQKGCSAGEACAFCHLPHVEQLREHKSRRSRGKRERARRFINQLAGELAQGHDEQPLEDLGLSATCSRDERTLAIAKVRLQQRLLLIQGNIRGRLGDDEDTTGVVSMDASPMKVQDRRFLVPEKIEVQPLMEPNMFLAPYIAQFLGETDGASQSSHDSKDAEELQMICFQV